MESALASYVFQPSVVAQFMAGVCGLAAMAGAVAFSIPKVAQRAIPRPKETRLADKLKFRYMHDDGKTIVCEDGYYAVVLSVRGTDLKFNDKGRQRTLNGARQAWVETMNEMGIRVREFFIRDRLPKPSEFPNKFGVMSEVSRAWAHGLPRPLSTEFYVVLSIKDEKRGVERLKEAADQTKSLLDDYGVKQLIEVDEVPESLEQADTQTFRDESGQEMRAAEAMTPLSFYSRMLSPITRPVLLGGTRGRDVSYRMCADVVRYDKDLSMFEFSNGPERKYAAVFVIEEWTTPLYESHMLDLLSYPIEMTICHDIQPISKGKALAGLRWQEKMAPGLQPGSDAAGQFAIVAAALEPQSEEEQELAQVQTTIVLYGDTPDDVLEARNRLTQIKVLGLNPLWAKNTAVQHWFSLLPGFDSMTRPQRLLSGEIAILSTFQNTPVGRVNSNWGEGPIAMFETLDGAPYAFQWHVPDGSNPPLGHCLSIGPSGGGKTTLMSFLTSQSLRHSDVKAFFFDRGRGCEIVTRALGGSYVFFDGEDRSVALNPMQLDDTPSNRKFLRDWLELVANVKEDEYELSQEIASAVDINYSAGLDNESRNLKKLWNIAFQAGSPLRDRMISWTSDNQYGPIVCAESDTLDLSQRLAGFDFTNIMSDPKLAPAMVSYLMHRILAEAKGDPRLIFIDETEPLLRDEAFKLRYKKLLQEGRKERQVIISAFQRPTAPADLGLSDTIRGQCPTVFFFRNPAAEPEDYADWKLSPREMAFVTGKSHRKNKYAVLLKRYTENQESVILNTDLSSLGPWMKIYQSGRLEVLEVQKLHQQYGADFLPHYIKS
ncbi:hypothetical protein [Sphingomonas sp. 3-13AW]|uniref:hypothetical protein n=1 Tax=Sphingomonas sp. 3-13AW TaxID=3050450 RepID=UPI003BB53645